MKNFIRDITLIFVFSIFSTSVHSQFSDYGVKIGVQSTNLVNTENNFFDTHFKTGFSIYGFAEYDLVQFVSSELQLGYTMRGFSNEINITNELGPEIIGRHKSNTSLHYLSTIFLLKSDFSLISRNVFLGIGPRVEFLIQKDMGEYYNGFIDDTATYFDDFLFGYALVAGLNNLNFLKQRISLELRYDRDITDSMSDYPRDARNHAIVASIGIGFK